ncbi:hypothetical protein [Phenylobacterium sp.]|uniref:hypothetical protein n=1 Tax=Phenylobacterium sp. TaxID=1871053 RepID=UPI0025E571A9|nr:hypothetical protein [Phenylobacterium sp.]MCA6318324.1 hypothetical protein [Phenylobacterium sp.]
MALDTVGDYVARARVLMQDTVDAPYRYSNVELVEALNLALLEARRLRPDLMIAFFKTSIPTYSASSLTTAVSIDEQYRTAFLYYIVGHAQLRDEENTQDARASVFLNKFVSQLLTIMA